MFPECEKRIPGSMTQNLEQHHLFEEGFQTMETYFNQVRKDPTLYDGKKVREMIEKFGSVFSNHLREEIGTLERSKLVAIFPIEEDLKKVFQAQMDWVISTSSKLTTMPWVISIFCWFNRRLLLITKRQMLLGS